MKKSIIILALLAAFASCNKTKKANEPTNPYETSILGKWKFDTKYYNTPVSEPIDHFWTMEFDGKKIKMPDNFNDSSYISVFYSIHDSLIYYGEDEQFTNGFLKFIINDITPYELFITNDNDDVKYRLVK